MRSIAAMTLASGLVLAPPAAATIVFDLSKASGPLLSPGAIEIGFKSLAGGALAEFEIAGHASLDGADNGYTDVFTFSHNGKDLFSGAFNLGGGGKDVRYFGASGSAFSVVTPGMWKGGTLQVAVPLELTEGVNILGFRYTGKAQGKADEAWSLNSLRVGSPAAGAVPEPASWAMMITGFGFVGAALRSRRLARRGSRAVSA